MQLDPALLDADELFRGAQQGLEPSRPANVQSDAMTQWLKLSARRS